DSSLRKQPDSGQRFVRPFWTHANNMAVTPSRTNAARYWWRLFSGRLPLSTNARRRRCCVSRRTAPVYYDLGEFPICLEIFSLSSHPSWQVTSSLYVYERSTTARP